MGYASGAWFLIGAGQLDSRPTLATCLATNAARSGFALHDIERNGEKGFNRIAPGFCTTPSSDKMRQYFLEQNDPDMAAWFRLNSMEYVQSLGGDPLLMVSEIPIFALDGTWTPETRCLDASSWCPQKPAPAPGSTRYETFRQELGRLRTNPSNDAGYRELIERYKVTPVPFDVQVKLQMQMVLCGLAAS